MIPELNTLYQIVGRIGQDVWRHKQILEPAHSSPILTHSSAERLYGPAAMAVHLSAKGSAPLALDGLKGAAAHTQKANLPNLPGLPQLGDKTYTIGDAVTVKGTSYTRTASGWQPIGGGSSVTNLTQGGGSGVSVGSSTALVDTHANRTAYPAANYQVGQLYFESDTRITYIVKVVSAANTWVYDSGVYDSAYANMPTLGLNDAGYLFGDTTYLHTWLWSGTAWGYAPGDCGSQYIVIAAAAPPGGVWYGCDGTGHTCTTSTGGTTTITPPNYNGTVAAIFGGGFGASVNPATSPTLSSPATASTISETGADVAVTTGSGNTVTLKTHTHNVTVSQALINSPSVANGGLPAYFGCSFWLRA